MTRDEAASTLKEVLMTLARNAVHNKRLTEYADDLERYIAYLDQEAEEAAKKPKKEEEKSDTKAE